MSSKLQGTQFGKQLINPIEPVVFGSPEYKIICMKLRSSVRNHNHYSWAQSSHYIWSFNNI